MTCNSGGCVPAGGGQGMMCNTMIGIICNIRIICNIIRIIYNMGYDSITGYARIC